MCFEMDTAGWKFSEYYDELDTSVKKRYQEKTKLRIRSNNFYSIGTTASQQLHNALQSITILSIILICVFSSHVIILIASVDSKIVYFYLRTPIKCSTCILAHDNLRAVSTSIRDNCFLLLVKEGILISAQNRPTES